jgi:hypothetical protein
MAKSRVHVTPHKGGGWQVIIGSNDRPSKVTDTQKQAIDVGKEIAKKLSTDLSIHGQDGKIRDVDSYGHDPCPPKDTKH